MSTRIREFAHRRPAVVVALAFLALRAVDALLMLVVARRDGLPLPDVLLSWDGGWYARAIADGWPEAAGAALRTGVEQSTWAWPPVYPLVVRLLAAPLGGTEPLMVLVNIGAGTMAAVVLMWLLRDRMGTRPAACIAILWASMPAAPVFLMAYAEGPFLLLLFCVAWAAVRERYLLAALLLLPAGLTKSSAAPYAVALIAVVVVRWRDRSRSGPAGGTVLAVTVLAVIGMLAWPAIVAIRLGSWDAYSAIQATWGRSSIPGRDTLAWIVHLGGTGVADTGLVLIMVIAALLAAVLAWRDRRLPLFVRVVGITSPAFLLTIGVGISTARLLLPDIAIPGVAGRLARGWSGLVLLSGVLLLLRFAWIATYISGVSGEPPP